jgi:hypothetical protein
MRVTNVLITPDTQGICHAAIAVLDAMTHGMIPEYMLAGHAVCSHAKYDKLVFEFDHDKTIEAAWRRCAISDVDFPVNKFLNKDYDTIEDFMKDTEETTQEFSCKDKPFTCAAAKETAENIPDAYKILRED